jgi:hypothetical protein
MGATDVDMGLLRLQFEILGTPIDRLATNNGLPVSILQKQAEQEKWTSLWPDESTPPSDAFAEALRQQSSVPPPEESEMDDLPSSPADILTEQTRKRLELFHLAKEAYLVAKYAALEVTLIAAIETTLSVPIITTTGLKEVINSYTDLLKNTKANNANLSKELSSLPMVVFKDLSGPPKE